MKGVKFGNYHSYNTWGLLLTAKEIGSPSVKEKKIEVEGADGVLDYTEVFGSVKYGNRSLKFDFQKPLKPSELVSLASDVQDAIHGLKMAVTLDDDPDWYYHGRVSVKDFSWKKGIGSITVEVDAEPYKLAQQLTTVSTTVDGSTRNLYDTSKIIMVSTAIKLRADDFFEVDVANNSGAWQYITFFHERFAEGEITPNQNVTIVLETKDVSASGNVETRLFFTSTNDLQPDYFAPSSYSTHLTTHERKTASLYPAVIRNAETISAAVYFIRSFIALADGGKIKGQFRISILSGDVRPDNFKYVSHSGNMHGLQLFNTKKRAVPTITASSAFTIYFEGKTFSVAAGTSRLQELELKEGFNDVAVKGTGTISFAWQKGRL